MVRCSRKSPDTQRAEKCSDINNVRVKWQCEGLFNLQQWDLIIYLDTIMRPQEVWPFNQVNIWHTTPVSVWLTHTADCRYVCVCTIFSFLTRDQMSSQWWKEWRRIREILQNKGIRMRFLKLNDYNTQGLDFLGFRNILWMKCTGVLISSIMLMCVCMCTSGQVQKVPIMRQSAKWSTLQTRLCVCVWVFEVPQRYQILAGMPNWTYCRLGRWREPEQSLGNNVSPSPPGEQITKMFSSQGMKKNYTHTHHAHLPGVLQT